ncbi:MAG: ATP-dependent zinc metalloprotease FtsH [Candidatus Shapirobacteria bacterium]|nr:ATP-dependent zinc metalloprotease FtsH [Candidatus Shapirobacteria bacterium]MDD3002687.1 ATP-dependent zinc metalloprotease FtsH [Candidatus Shapirobacteria bacterium]MDD4382891.1 ATP-dependent zinc metalloprotease FtsH [Candidatus Shapirobacteria bacterium]
MKFFEDLKKKIKKPKLEKKNSPKQNNKNQIPKELLDKLPPGVKIKRIEIGPKQIVKFLIYLILGYWILSVLMQFLVPETVSQVPISEVIQKTKNNEVEKIVVADSQIVATLKNEKKILVASKEVDISMTEILQKEGVNLSTVNLQIENRQGWKMLGEILTLVLSVGLPIMFILWLFKKQSGGAGGGVFGFGKSTAKLFIKGKQSLTFKDVAGVEEAKNDLVEIVDFLKHPEKYQKMGARAPKGVLLVGPSGVGKTLLAKAVAGEAGVPFYSMAGSEFMEMLVGVGASRVRDLFGTAKKAGKAIIFIDEIDAIGRVRGGMEGGNSEREQTLNQILVEMDGFEPNSAVVVLAATNRGDLLDPALLRPGRFDRRVVLELPDLEARQEILKIHAKGKPFEEEVNWETVAKSTVGFSGAELENMLNEAAIGAARLDKTKIGMKDIDEASLKVKLGAEKRRSQSDEDKLMTAYHEAGHAIVNYVEDLDPVSKISIISRGMALGFTLVPPQKDIIHHTKSKLIKKMAMAMGGRAAEEIIFKDITTGASSDISHATNIARDMVIEWGMSDIGPINLGSQIDVNDFGKSYMETSKLSDKMQGKIDEEIKKFIDEAYTEAKKVLIKNKEKLDKLAKVLAEKESLDQKEFEELMK